MKNQEKKNWKYKWALEALFITFILSLLISYVSTNAINNLSLFPAILILILVVFVGVTMDTVGIAVTVGSEEDFHAKASKKIEGAKSSIKLIRNSAKVANICCDVVGDICRSTKWSNKCNACSKNSKYFRYKYKHEFFD